MANQRQVAPANQVKALVEQVGGKFNSIIKESGLSLSWEKEKAYAIMAISDNPKLQNCTPASIQKAVYNVALTGLSLNPKMAHCYLIPRAGKAVLDISYQGLIYLMTNALDVNRIHSDVIYENDFFEYFTDETGTKLKHQPKLFSERGKKLGAYAIAWLNKSNQAIAVVLNKKEIEAIKATSQSANSDYSPWNNFEDEMWKKTVIRRLWKMIPKTERIEQAVEGISVMDENHEPNFKAKTEPAKAQSFDDFIEADEVVEVEDNEEKK